MGKDKKKKKKGGSAAGKLKAFADNRIVADVVAAALVATASALKDSKKAQRLASTASDELEKLSKKGAEQGNAMWKLALDIGRRALDEIAGGSKAPKTPKAPKAPKPPKRPKPPKTPKAPRRQKKSASKATRKTSRAKRK